MSASTIPNLRTLRRGGLRGRGAGQSVEGRRGHRSPDELVQETDRDAASSRVSAVNTGYLDDPFASLLMPDPVQRKLPLMNRGTYARTIGIDTIVNTFIASYPGRKQIVSFGAGSDTRFFRLRRAHPDLDIVYHEIDFAANTETKISKLKSAAFVQAAHRLCSVNVDEFEISGSSMFSSNYNIHAQDLRHLPLSLPGMKTDLPTLLISECCLIYLAPEDAEAVMTHFTDIFTTTPLAIIIYEPIRPDDSFGKTMVRNLIARGLHLHTLERYADLAHQEQRLKAYQFEARAEDIEFVWKNWVSSDEKDRIDKLEWMDEVEEFVLLARHYCIAWGWRNWQDHSKWSEISASYTTASY